VCRLGPEAFLVVAATIVARPVTAVAAGSQDKPVAGTETWDRESHLHR
jgi:hypothetical protein